MRNNRWKSLKKITAEFNESTVCRPVSAKTVRRRLKELGYKPCILVKKPLISEKNRLKRLDFYRGCIVLGALTNGKISYGQTKVDTSYFILTEGKKYGVSHTSAISRSALGRQSKEMAGQL